MKNTKKIFAFLLICTLTLCLFACNGREDTSKPELPVGGTDTDGYLGYAFIPEKAGEKPDFNGVFCAVVIDRDGKVLMCKIDQLEAQAKTDGISEQIGSSFLTKKQLGASYGMAEASPIKKEWSEQIAAFEEYCVGKTVSQIKSAVKKDGKVPDLSASCTVNVSPYVNGVEAASKSFGKAFSMENAESIGIYIDCTLSSSSVGATESTDGKAVYDCLMAANVADGEGKLLRGYIDEAQAEYSFDEDGEYEGADGYIPLSKRQQGYDYGLKQASSIKKEWFEQADAFTDYCVGKTVSQIIGSVGENGKIPDLISSCTIYSGGYAKAITESMENK